MQHLIHFDYHNLLVAILTSPMQCTSDGHCSMLYVPCQFVSFFLFDNGEPKCYKKCGKFICEQPAKVWKIYWFHHFPVLVISRKCDIKVEK